MMFPLKPSLGHHYPKAPTGNIQNHFKQKTSQNNNVDYLTDNVTLFVEDEGSALTSTMLSDGPIILHSLATWIAVSKLSPV